MCMHVVKPLLKIDMIYDCVELLYRVYKLTVRIVIEIMNIKTRTQCNGKNHKTMKEKKSKQRDTYKRNKIFYITSHVSAFMTRHTARDQASSVV